MDHLARHALVQQIQFTVKKLPLATSTSSSGGPTRPAASRCDKPIARSGRSEQPARVGRQADCAISFSWCGNTSAGRLLPSSPSNPSASNNASTASRTGSPRPWSSKSRTVKKLPSDWTSSSPRPAASRCASRSSQAAGWAQQDAQFSWCGNCRSIPPPEAFAQERMAHGRALDMPAGLCPNRADRRSTVSTARNPSGRACRARPRPARPRSCPRPTGPRAARIRHRNARRTGHAPPPRRHGRGDQGRSIIATICGM
jgi:hypothetical protein